MYLYPKSNAWIPLKIHKAIQFNYLHNICIKSSTYVSFKYSKRLTLKRFKIKYKIIFFYCKFIQNKNIFYV